MRRRIDAHFDPFETPILDRMFEPTSSRPDVLKRRESATFEYKFSFSASPDAKAKYAKTLAAFANNRGGYIVFGVENHPHRLCGLSSDRFQSMDPRELTTFLRDHFSPEIAWEHRVHEVRGLVVGLIYAFESDAKPVVCVASQGDIREGSVYYRYSGESRNIGGADLLHLVSRRIDQERDSWQQLIAKVATISPSATYLLDVNSGRATGEAQSFVISEDLLDKIKFIHEGRFHEAGDPTLNVLGEVEVVRTELVPGTVERVPIDPSEHCTLWECEVVNRLKECIGENVAFGDSTKPLTGSMIRELRDVHGIETPSMYYYRPFKRGSRPMYSDDFVDYVREQYRANDQVFYDAHAAWQGGILGDPEPVIVQTLQASLPN